MKMVCNILALAGVFFLAACASGYSSYNLNRAQAIGSPFAKVLAQEYRTLANHLTSGDGDYFVRKGLAAADGVTVMPEMPLNSNDADKHLAYQNLVTMLDVGGRTLAPESAAIAQTRFDCWVRLNHSACKDAFYTTLQDAQKISNPSLLAADTMPSPTGFPAPIYGESQKPYTPVTEAMFLVFFDWDKHDISLSGSDVLDATAEEIMQRHDVLGLIVTGHADTSGPEQYNQNLSVRRAKAVRESLVARGIKSTMIRIEGRGETDLLEKTPDNVREPANRRAEITLE